MDRTNRTDRMDGVDRMDRVTAWVDTTVQDLRFALRSWIKAPTFAIAALATLALGIGANTAMFAIVSGVLLRPLPFLQPDALVQVNETQPRDDGSIGFDGPVVYGDFEQWRTHSRLFDRLVTYVQARRNLQVDRPGETEPEQVIAVAADRGLFPMLGVAAFLGRTFADGDPGDVAVASYGFWRDSFQADPSVVGRRVTMDGQPFTVIGVMPEGFQFPYRTSSTAQRDGRSATAFWIPWDVPADLRANATNRRVDVVVARVKPGVALEAARRELAAMQGPVEGRRLVRITPLKELVSGPVRQSLLVLLGAVGLVLLVACVNVANLLLARTASRGSEMALRAALGASRARLMRQLLAESLLMALVAGVAGLAIGMWGSRVLVALAAGQIPRIHEIGLDWRVFTFLLAACVTTGIGCGLGPAMSAARGGAATIRRGGAGAALRDGLVVVEVALAFVLLAGAGLLLRTFLNLQQTDPGLNPDRVLTAHIVVSGARESLAIEERVAQIPGVRAAGLISQLPLQQSGWGGAFAIAGRAALHEAQLRYATPGYFRAMGITVRRGRGFLPHDARGAPMVIVINDALARRYFPDEDPIGRETNRGTIVGVVGDVRQASLREPAVPEIYHTVAQNFAQLGAQGSTLVVRSDAAPLAMVGAIRAAIREISPGQALFRVETMQGVIEASLATPRLYAWLIGLFAAMGLLLAMTGIYGVIAFLVARRTREIGIRMALGANAGQVLRMVMADGARLTALGLAVGVGLAIAVTRVLRGALYGVATTDAATFGAMAVLLAAAALAAYLVPAHRASRVDPSLALRDG